uniref:Uncharacterized protein n=1 Tax=Amphimedon queenslandica TaxID=400682 RepID=A0A1X7TT28_AMPQE
MFNLDKNNEFLLAAKNSNIASLKRGLSNGVDVNCQHQLGWTALHVSVINGSKKAVEWLIKVGGANVNIQNEYSSARRMARVLKASHHQIAQLREHHFCSFINHYATYTGFTPLHYAVIIDNKDIIQLLLDNVHKCWLGWNDTDHPLVFLFLGSSKIGKTELAKQTANYLHKDNPKGFIRIDMSEY